MHKETYEEYIRSILGYPANRNIYDIGENIQYTNSLNYNSNIFETTDELEQYYPEIYSTIYPEVRNVCLKNSNPISKNLLDNMVEEVYNFLETTQENRTNMSLSNNQKNNSSNKAENRIKTDENRQRPNNNFLQDLIRILILRELTERPGRPPRPRPPFGPPQRQFM